MAAMQLPVNLKMLIDFCKNQERQTLGFSSSAHLPPYFSLLPIHWNCQGQVLLWVQKKLFTHSAFGRKEKQEWSCEYLLCVKVQFFIAVAELPTRGKTIWVVISVWPTFSSKAAAPFDKDAGLSFLPWSFLLTFHRRTSADCSFLTYAYKLVWFIQISHVNEMNVAVAISGSH